MIWCVWFDLFENYTRKFDEQIQVQPKIEWNSGDEPHKKNIFSLYLWIDWDNWVRKKTLNQQYMYGIRMLHS